MECLIKMLQTQRSGNNNPMGCYTVIPGVSYHLNGDIAPVTRVYQGKSLTAAEVLQNFNAQKSRFGL